MAETQKERFNADELSAPDWMDKGFFKKVFSEIHNDDDVQVLSNVTLSKFTNS